MRTAFQGLNCVKIQHFPLGNSPVISVCSVFGQAGQTQPSPAQQGMYNNMSITVSMAGGNASVQNMNPMTGQMPMSSLQMPGMNPMCSEQVSATSCVSLDFLQTPFNSSQRQ